MRQMRIITDRQTDRQLQVCLLCMLKKYSLASQAYLVRKFCAQGMPFYFARER